MGAMTMFTKGSTNDSEGPSAKPDHGPALRLTPDGHEVVPGAIAQGFPQAWPELRVQAIYETVEPDTFRGQVLCGGTVLEVTEVTEFEPEAIRRAEELVVAAVGRLFDCSDQHPPV
jgi:hypothetical protein